MAASHSHSSAAEPTASTRDVDIVVVGFGFSAIPLLRELERTGEDFVVLEKSEGGTVWHRLERDGKLDFDLVSSYYSSFYSFDLASTPKLKKDHFPTAREYFDMHQRHYATYRRHVVIGRVTLVENHDDASYVHTEGVVYKATKVVLATGYTRAAHTTFKKFDFNMDNQTVVIDSIGDTANLMFAKLVSRNNRIISLNDGFISLDKQTTYGGIQYSIDQLEFHNVEQISPTLYSTCILPLPVPGITAHLETARQQVTDIVLSSPASLPHGLIAIKYWPIDEYARAFGDDLECAVLRGNLLNDVAYFVDQKLVEMWPKRDTSVDEENSTIMCGDRVVKYDHIIKGNKERPQFPSIVRHSGGETHTYSYVYRESYLGVVPSKLHNVFFLGLTRPQTGGLANITEMQSLLVHKMVTNNSFNRRIYLEMPQRMRAYDANYYGTRRLGKPGKTDHVVHFGFYTKDVARAIGIDTTLTGCRSWAEINDWLWSPNLAAKFRVRGEYAVPGIDKLLSFAAEKACHFRLVRAAVLNAVAWFAALFLLGVLSFVSGSISWKELSVYLFAAYMVGFVPVNVLVHRSFHRTWPRLFKNLLSVGLVLSMAAGVAARSPQPLIGGMAATGLLVAVMQSTGQMRIPFNDYRNKPAYRPFFERYCQAYNATKGIKKAKGL